MRQQGKPTMRVPTMSSFASGVAMSLAPPWGPGTVRLRAVQLVTHVIQCREGGGSTNLTTVPATFASPASPVLRRRSRRSSCSSRDTYDGSVKPRSSSSHGQMEKIVEESKRRCQFEAHALPPSLLHPVNPPGSSQSSLLRSAVTIDPHAPPPTGNAPPWNLASAISLTMPPDWLPARLIDPPPEPPPKPRPILTARPVSPGPSYLGNAIPPPWSAGPSQRPAPPLPPPLPPDQS